MKKLKQRGILLLGIALVGACAGKRLNDVGELGDAGGTGGAGATAGVATSGGKVGNAAGKSSMEGGSSSLGGEGPDPIAGAGYGGEVEPLNCTNEARDGTETDVDCGGGCPGCDTGQHCYGGEDCASGECGGPLDNETCEPLHCGNHVKDLDEGDVDCGGADCDKCETGQLCERNSDCWLNNCKTGVCIQPCKRLSDCGTDAACEDGQCVYCTFSDECRYSNQTCSAASGLDCACRQGYTVCVEASCENGLQEAGETDVDCGGSDCQACADYQRCAENVDCASGYCAFAPNRNTLYQYCFPAHCNNHVKDEDESGQDCGGPSCVPCDKGYECQTEDDCDYKLSCDEHLCVQHCTEQTAFVCGAYACSGGRCVECETPDDCLGTCGRNSEMQCNNQFCQCTP